ncbi:hypothetical protein DFH09DRAFT_1374376 [Mycena vulgaris]|nr:hypothetical protein DFH09DRAFT_1374376 [Mycena vulgaris]
MAATTALPKTTHVLHHDQRARLMRSTRKVEALLGETPLLVDPSTPQNSSFPNSNPDFASRRPPFIYAATPRSSSLGVYTPHAHAHTSTSTSRAHPHPHPHVRPLLSVRLPPDSEPPASATSLAFPPDAAACPPSPGPADDPRWQRTRKMARVVRTLGARVPHELVFPAGAAPHPRPHTLTKRRARAPSSASRAGAGTAAQDGRGEATAEDSGSETASVYSTLSGGDWVSVGAPGPPGLLSSVPIPIPTPASSSSAPRWGYERGMDATTGTHDRGRLPSSNSSSPPIRAAPTPSSFSAPAASTSTSQPPKSILRPSATPASAPAPTPPEPEVVGYDRGTHRTERGWSGEWVATGAGVGQMQSMNDVARQLRELRGR